MFDERAFPDLLVGLSVADDAAVWRVSDDRALVFTADFFTPVVDDPRDWGAIAAANALSDIYAMGADPFLALNLAAFPTDLPDEIVAQVIRGAAEVVRDAGAVVAGGHTIVDEEPKFGLAALGWVHPDRVGTKSAAQPGDCILLTKPLGVGVVTTAAKWDEADADELAIVTLWMRQLNRAAAEALRTLPALHAVTDITGFGLLGHAWEVADKSGVRLRLQYGALPFHPGVARHAEAEMFPGMAACNQGDYGEHVRFAPGLAARQQLLCFSPETSGGLFVTLPPGQVAAFQGHLHERGQEAWEIGMVLDGPPGIEVEI